MRQQQSIRLLNTCKTNKRDNQQAHVSTANDACQAAYDYTLVPLYNTTRLPGCQPP